MPESTRARAKQEGRGIWCIFRTSPNTLWQQTPPAPILLTIATWQFQFHIVKCQYSPLKIRIWFSKREPFRVLIIYCVTWCPLTMGIVASQCTPARVTAFERRYPTPLISACLNPLKAVVIAGISPKRCNWLALRARWHTQWLSTKR